MFRFLVLFFMIGHVSALAVAANADASEFKFALGINYLSGHKAVSDLLEENLQAEGYHQLSRKIDIPFGITLNPYVQYPNGLRIGVGIGPVMIIEINGRNPDFDMANFFDFPLSLDLGYTLWPSSDISPYAKIGLIHHLAAGWSGGDYVQDTSPGFYWATGVELFRKNSTSLGIQFAYDYSTIQFEKSVRYEDSQGQSQTRIIQEKIRPNQFMISLFAVF